MAVDLAAFPMKMEDEMGIEEGAWGSLQGMEEHLISILSKEGVSHLDFSVSKLKRLISLFNRTGHARFRRAPPSVSHSALSPNSASITHFPHFNPPDPTKAPTESLPEFSSTSSFLSTITGDGSVSNPNPNPKLDLSLFPPPPPAKKPPLSSKRKCHDSSSKPCHCAANYPRKSSRAKKTVRVPAMSSKVADIPSDEFSWRKYGQKPIKGSPYPRGYYRCSTVKGCPARKHVERARDDPTMLLVTYDGDHRHPQPTVTDPTLRFIPHQS